MRDQPLSPDSLSQMLSVEAKVQGLHDERFDVDDDRLFHRVSGQSWNLSPLDFTLLSDTDILHNRIRPFLRKVKTWRHHQMFANQKPTLQPYKDRKLHDNQPSHPLLEERATTHGSFEENARISQRLKAVIRNCSESNWSLLDDVEKEVMDNIMLKFSRILSGKSMEKQHWEDVEGYAKLVLRKIANGN